MSSESESPKKRVRNDNDIYLIGSIEHQIVGTKLPSNRQVLSVYFYNTRIAKLNEQESAKLVADEVSIFYAKARIPTALPHNNLLKVIKLKNKYREVQKIAHKTTQANIDKEREFIEKLDDLFDMSHKNAMDMIKDKDIRDFLVAQREKGRNGCFLGIAETHDEIDRRREMRAQQQEARKAKAAKDASSNGI